jgi:hypothetical protein
MAKSIPRPDVLKKLMSKVYEELEDNSLETLDSKCVSDAYNKLYSHGQIIKGADNYLTFSYTNLTGKYQQKLIMTAMIGYIFRANDEWEVDDDVKVFPVYDYVKGLENGTNIIDEYYKTFGEISPRLEKAINETKKKMKERIVIRRFLEHLFQFDPDKHVRSAYRPQPRDKEREIIETPAAKLAVACLKFKDAEFRQNMLENERNLNMMNMSAGIKEKKPYNVDFFNDLVDPECEVVPKVTREFEKSDEQLYKTASKLVEKYENIDQLNVEYLNSAVNIMDDAFDRINRKFRLDYDVLQDIKREIAVSYEGRLGILQTENRKGVTVLRDIMSTLHRDYGLIDNKVHVNTYNMIPPEDTFHRIRYYMEANYDSIIEAVKNLYCDCPALDMAILPHNWHANEDAAQEYIKTHKNQAVAEIVPACSGQWNFFAPYSKVRDTTKFLNDKTIVLEEILAQNKRDQKLGADLMEKTMKVKKRKNIEEEGKEADEFVEWRNNNNVLQSMGAKQIDPYADDCPPDAVEIDVYTLNAKSGKMKHDKLYTKAEAPEFMEENKKREAEVEEFNKWKQDKENSKGHN